MVKHLPSMFKALGSIPSTAKSSPMLEHTVLPTVPLQRCSEGSSAWALCPPRGSIVSFLSANNKSHCHVSWPFFHKHIAVHTAILSTYHFSEYSRPHLWPFLWFRVFFKSLLIYLPLPRSRNSLFYCKSWHSGHQYKPYRRLNWVSNLKKCPLLTVFPERGSYIPKSLICFPKRTNSHSNCFKICLSEETWEEFFKSLNEVLFLQECKFLFKNETIQVKHDCP